MESLKNIKQNSLFFILVFLFHFILFLFLFSIGPKATPDTMGYVNALIARAPGYPIFIDFFQAIFGERFQGLLVTFQLLLGFSGMIYFVLTLAKIFSVNKWILFGVSIVVMLPYVLSSEIGNYILSEALAYPLSLFFISFLLFAAYRENTKHFLYAASLLLILSLTRGQFLFAIPLAIAVVIYIAIIRKDFKKYIIVLLSFVLLPIFSNVLDKAYHKVYFDHFVSTPWTGIHLAALPFFVSDEEDYMIFDEIEKQKYFRAIYSELRNKQLTLLDFKENNEDSRGYAYYAQNSTAIANFTIDPVGRNFFNKRDLHESLILNDKITKSIALPLIIDNFGKWLKFYIMNVITGIGHERMFLLYPIFIFLSAIGLIKAYNPLALFILISFLYSLSNIVLVALVQPLTFYRYTIYGDFLIYTVFLLLLNKVLFNKDFHYNRIIN